MCSLMPYLVLSRFLGAFFDVYYKANNRNVRLLKQYYEDGKHRGSATGVVVSVLLVTVLIVAGLIYGTLGWFWRIYLD
jgi:hypothetical protein